MERAAIQVALRFSIFGALAVGAFLVYNYLTKEESPHQESSKDKKSKKDEPFIVNIARECPICIEPFSEEDTNVNRRRVFLPRCGHQLHKGCFDELKTINDFCPLCRVKFQ